MNSLPEALNAMAWSVGKATGAPFVRNSLANKSTVSFDLQLTICGDRTRVNVQEQEQEQDV